MFGLHVAAFPPNFGDAKAAPGIGKSKPFKALGCCTSRQNSGIHEKWNHDQWHGLVKRLSTNWIMARRVAHSAGRCDAILG
ncbi:MAG: hypothetical protein DLM68_01660 [Hyphomicrobiales bacterium]|nr:MAG: hypothetical protein DLM68_01660 [Hyphomicrobiales bacterium]